MKTLNSHCCNNTCPPYVTYTHTRTNTHTYTHTRNHLMALCLELPKWASTKRSTHPLTPILIITAMKQTATLTAVSSHSVAVSCKYCWVYRLWACLAHKSATFCGEMQALAQYTVPWAPRFYNPNSTLTGSDIFAGFMVVSNRQTDHATSVTSSWILMVWMWCGLK